jgi:hypothetical protein
MCTTFIEQNASCQKELCNSITKHNYQENISSAPFMLMLLACQQS